VDGPTKIALLVGQGDITRGSTNDSGDNGITSAGMIRQLRAVRDDASIKAVILRIDSPGGDGIASDDILHEVKLLSQKKPNMTSMSDLPASVGVFFGKVNLRGLYDKLGIKKEIIKRGRFADIDTEYAPLNDEQRAKLRTEI